MAAMYQKKLIYIPDFHLSFLESLLLSEIRSMVTLACVTYYPRSRERSLAAPRTAEQVGPIVTRT